MHFPKNKTLGQKEKAFRLAMDELTAHKASTAGLRRAVVLAEAGVGDLPDAIMALSENAAGLESTETKLGMCRSDIYAHLENDIAEAKEKLPVDEAELLAVRASLESELIEKLTRCETLLGALGGPWLHVSEKFKSLRQDELKHPLKFRPQNFEDLEDFRIEAARVSRLKAADPGALVRDAYVHATKRACGKGEPPPPVVKKKAAA